jgi:hypothetical protein
MNGTNTMTQRSIVAVFAALTALLGAGCVAMAIAHAGVEVPLLSRLGPGGNRAVVPAVIAFTIAAVLLFVLASGALRRQSWSWALGLLTHALVFLGAAVPFRGAGSAVAMIIAAACVALLMTRQARATLLAR